jgi:hypothetical protein
MPAYVSGGTVTPLGGDSGYFDFGTITFLDGLNAGRSMEIQAYVPGQIRLQLPMPYAVSPGRFVPNPRWLRQIVVHVS